VSEPRRARDIVTGITDVGLAYLSFLCTQPSTMLNQESQSWRPETYKSHGIGAKPSTTSGYRVQHSVSWVMLVSPGRSASKYCSDGKVDLV
jgi:hypothetical protein